MKALNMNSLKILESGPFVPRKENLVPTDKDNGNPQEFIPKDSSDYTDRDKKLISLDADLQSLIVESMDSNMRHRIKDCVSAKHMWETIAAIVEGIEDKNRLNSLMSEYKEFKSLPSESVS